MANLLGLGKVVRDPGSILELARQNRLPLPLSLRALIDTLGTPTEAAIPFAYGVNNLGFSNFSDGVPDWGTFEDTFGASEVWHEQVDPLFGHPILTAAFYQFYQYFLKGQAQGGLATGFCTSLAALVADSLWTGRTDTPSITKASVHRQLTAIHGRLLSRESLLHFHQQGREGLPRVERSCREIETTFLRGCDRRRAPLLFFIPSGEVWDGGYFEKLGNSHCVMPYRFEYPAGHPGPRLAPDGTTTLTDLDNVALLVWDCNHPQSPNCRLVLKQSGGQLGFEYFPDGSGPQFRSADGLTLGMMTNGRYLLEDHDLPFSGPGGLVSFIVDFLLSPADLQVTDPSGLRTGNFGGQIRAEIPDSHPFYLVPGAYLLPPGPALNRRITGTATGRYSFTSLAPAGASLAFQDLATAAGQVDEVSISPDQTQVRFAPGAEKTFTLTVARRNGEQMKALAIRGLGGGAAAPVELNSSPTLSFIELTNHGAARRIEMQGQILQRSAKSRPSRQLASLDLPAGNTLRVDVQSWNTLDASVALRPNRVR